jgi:hypothetical protein
METSLPSFQTATEIQAPATTKERLASAHPLSGGVGCECGFRSCCFSDGLKSDPKLEDGIQT